MTSGLGAGRSSRARSSGTRRELAGDDGSAVVEFALVTPLVLLLFAAIVQVGLVGYLRTTLIAAAADGARAGALVGAPSGAATLRTHSALADSLAEGIVTDVSEVRERDSGVATIVVTVHARLPLFGLLGPETLTVRGRALQEV